MLLEPEQTGRLGLSKTKRVKDFAKFRPFHF
jgi:hypothetical protein